MNQQKPLFQVRVIPSYIFTMENIESSPQAHGRNKHHLILKSRIVIGATTPYKLYFLLKMKKLLYPASPVMITSSPVGVPMRILMASPMFRTSVLLLQKMKTPMSKAVLRVKRIQTWMESTTEMISAREPKQVMLQAAMDVHRHSCKIRMETESPTPMTYVQGHF